MKSVQRILSLLTVSEQSPLSWLQNPSEHATSDPSGEDIRLEEPDMVSQQPFPFPEEYPQSWECTGDWVPLLDRCIFLGEHWGSRHEVHASLAS